MTITCAKTGFNATIEFHTKPFYGGKKHRISGEVFQPGDKKPFLSISGEWNGSMHAKWVDGVCTLCNAISHGPLHKFMKCYSKVNIIKFVLFSEIRGIFKCE